MSSTSAPVKFVRKAQKAAGVPLEQIVELKTSIADHNPYRFEPSETRNVLMVGRSRSGKSTAVGVLKDPTYFPKQMSIFSETVVSRFQTFALECIGDAKAGESPKKKYTLNIIDTPGLMEVVPEGKEANSDEFILNGVHECLKNEITRINCLLIFVSFESGISRDDIACFEKYYEHFYHQQIPVIVCITRAEDKVDSWKTKIESELKQHAKFRKLLERDNVKLRFMGCVDENTIEAQRSIEALNDLYSSVFDMREELLLDIFNSEEKVSLLDLPIAKGRSEKAKSLLKEQIQRLKDLSEVKDLEFQHPQAEINKVIAANGQLKALKDYLRLDDEEAIRDFNQLKRLMLNIAERIPTPQRKKEFLHNTTIQLEQ